MPELSRLTWPEPSKSEPSQCVLAVRWVAMHYSFAVLWSRAGVVPSSVRGTTGALPAIPAAASGSRVETAGAWWACVRRRSARGERGVVERLLRQPGCGCDVGRHVLEPLAGVHPSPYAGNRLLDGRPPPLG